MISRSEEAVIGYLLVAPDLLKGLSLEDSFFKSERERRIFREIQKGVNDIVLIAQNLSDDREIPGYLARILEGVPKIPAANLRLHIDKIKRTRLKEGVLKLINNGAKTDMFDHEKIMDTYFKIRNLEFEGDGCCWIELEAVEPRAIEWLWWNRIPAGSLTLLVGDPGDGKSTLAIYLCSQITRGNPLPDKHARDSKGSILYYTAEDVLSDTVRVRAEDGGADLSKFIVNTGEKQSGEFISIQNDLRSLENKITELKDVQVVVFDPITAFMGDAESNKVTTVRAALAPLARLAEKHKISIIAISHLNKDAAKKAIYRTLGSIAFVAAARTVWLVQRDEDDPKRERRFFAPLKYNVCKNPTTLAFTISGPIGRPIVEFEPDPVDVTSDELLADEGGKDRIGAIREAKIFLSEIMKNEAILAADVYKKASGVKISQRTLNRAKAQLGILSVQKERQWYWEKVKI